MLDLTRLMFDDGATRPVVGTPETASPEIDGDVEYVGSFPMFNRTWQMFHITKLNTEIQTSGWWVDVDDIQEIRDDIENFVNDRGWKFNQTNVPGWGTEVTIRPKDVEGLTLLYFVESPCST